MQVGSTQASDRPIRSRGPFIVFTVDGNFTLPLAVTLHSMLSNLRGAESVQVFILHSFLPDATKDRLQAVAEQARTTAYLSFIEVDAKEEFEHLELDYYGRFTEAIYFRLLIGSFLPPQIGKVIYLDSDLVVEDNLLELWSKDLGEKILGAVQERTVSCPMHGLSRWVELGLDPGDPFFNSGVMLIDLEGWRAQNIGTRVLEYLHQYRDSLNMKGNQEGFNAVLAGQWMPLPPKWNVLHHYYDSDLFDFFGQPVYSDRVLSEITQEPSIIHFTDGPKPWQPGCTHPARDRFYHYLRQSGWFSPVEYLDWRAVLALKDSLHTVKEVTRPFRHRIGLHR